MPGYIVHFKQNLCLWWMNVRSEVKVFLFLQMILCSCSMFIWGVCSMLSLLSTLAFCHCALLAFCVCVWLATFFGMHGQLMLQSSIPMDDWSIVHVNQMICHPPTLSSNCFVYITWRSGAVIGFATSQADNHGFTWAKNPVCSSFGKFELLPIVGLLCWLVLRRAPKINASAITTSPGPGRILTSGSGSAVLAWCKHDWDALATRNDIVA